MNKKIECWKCGAEYDEDEYFCPECEADIEPNESRFVSSKSAFEGKTQRIGAWILISCSWSGIRGEEPPLYTKTSADLIKHKKTGKKYKRGASKLFVIHSGEVSPIFVEKSLSISPKNRNISAWENLNNSSEKSNISLLVALYSRMS